MPGPPLQQPGRAWRSVGRETGTTAPSPSRCLRRFETLCDIFAPSAGMLTQTPIEGARGEESNPRAPGAERA